MFCQALTQNNNQKSEIKFKNVAGPKPSGPMKIKSAASILYHNSVITTMPSTLYISLSLQDQSIQSLIFSYGKETRVQQLTQYIKQKLSMSNIYFKSNNILIDHFLTLNDRYVMELNLNKIYLTVHSVEVFDKISLKCVEVLKCVGSGGFSKVLLARVYGIMMAIKIIDKQFVFRTAKQSIVQNQKAILQICEGHPFITKLFFSFQTNKFIVLGMQYCNGGELFNLLRRVKKMRESDARFYFIQTLMAIQHLHSKGILYRDLKPENIIIDANGHVRLADFGLSKIINRSVTYSFCGSAQYMSPEMLLKKGHSYQVDYYCIGALLYELVTGLPPFYSQNQTQLFNGILNNQLTFPSHALISDQLKFFLYKILQKQPEKRFQNIAQIINDPWVAYDFNREQVLNKKLVPPFPTTPLNYNFDDSQFQNQQSSILRMMRNQADSFQDPKLRCFKDFYYESDQIFKLRQQVDKNNFKNFMKNKMKQKKKQFYVPSRNNSVYSQKQLLTQPHKKISLKMQDQSVSGTTSSLISPKNSLNHTKSAQNIKNLIGLYSTQKRSSTKNLNIYTNKPKFSGSNILKNSKLGSVPYGNFHQKSLQMKLNTSLSREHNSIEWLKQKSSSLDKGYTYKPHQFNSYSKNYYAEYKQKYATPKVKKSFRTGDRINFHYGSVNR